MPAATLAGPQDAAKALLGKVYLTSGDFNKAKDKLNEVIVPVLTHCWTTILRYCRFPMPIPGIHF
ncbi:hypothetical protein [Dyadobacter sp. CY323]|uniref:hypothetical protein n=1 Tax=Dyadobacter sp. CY323 TaxID=2907302 RepID=UPI001F45FBDE|nr:hypothetical protein [Dyadobacter sp. CY323]MCE6989866.1 hypothetical protein [Dyadobacter sp. CY323]